LDVYLSANPPEEKYVICSTCALVIN